MKRAGATPIVLSLVCLTGCTGTLLTHTAEKYVSYPIPEHYSLRIANACYVEKTKDIVIVMERHNKVAGTAENFYMQYRDPHFIPYGKRAGEVEYGVHWLKKINGTLVAFRGNPVYNSQLCAGTLPILELEDGEKATLPDYAEQAIYVQYMEDNLFALGYVSKKPFLDENYSFQIDITKQEAYYLKKKEKGNPILLVLTPVTVALDVTGAIILTPAFALICIDEPDCLK